MIKPSTLASGIVIFALLFLLSACGEQKNEKKDTAASLPPAPVVVDKVKIETADSLVNVVGTVEAVQHATIAARISGQIIELPVVLGSEVEKKSLLVKIKAGEIEARFLPAEAELARARRNLEREEKLQQEDASTLETVKSLRDMVSIARAACQEAGAMLEYTTIIAPFSGVVTSKTANVGDLAFPGMELLGLENNRKLQVVAQVPEARLLAVTVGDRLPVNIPAAGLNLEGEVSEIAPAANSLTRTAAVKISIPVDPALRAGQFARVSLADSSSTLLMVAESALITRGQMKIVLVVKDKRARLRLVRTGAEHNGRVEIIAGLDSGELVVIRGAARLQDGRPLTVEANE